jgi:hypothetical protein
MHRRLTLPSACDRSRPYGAKGQNIPLLAGAKLNKVPDWRRRPFAYFSARAFTRPARIALASAANQDVYAFIFGQRGPMAGIGIRGNKITRLTR